MPSGSASSKETRLEAIEKASFIWFVQIKGTDFNQSNSISSLSEGTSTASRSISSPLNSTRASADKYLLRQFEGTFFEYIKNILDAENNCLIYNQLVKIKHEEEVSMACVNNMKCKEIITQIEQEKLNHLVSLDESSIAKFNLVVSVLLKWINRELQRRGMPVNRENRRKNF